MDKDKTIKKKRKYEKPLKIKGDFNEVLKVSGKKKDKPDKK